MKIQEQVGLAGYTTFGVGGAARWFVEAATEADVVEAFRWAEQRGLPLFVLGGGSNLLVPDEGFPGLVLRVAVKGLEHDGAGRFDVGAGESWDEFVSRTVELGCAGVECLAGIPGSLGGTPVQNVGAYGQEVAETIVSVRAFDRAAREFSEIGNAECGFRYRESVFNTSQRGRYIVTRVRFGLRLGGEPTLKYAELREKAFNAEGAEEKRGGRGGGPSLGEVAGAVREIRAGKGMVLREGDLDSRSAGSFFKNPIVGVEVADRIDGVPQWAAGEGKVKLAAAWLLEKAGFVKGYGTGPVKISSKHTLALTNRGGATFADVEAMEREIVAGVEGKFGVRLEREPVVLV